MRIAVVGKGGAGKSVVAGTAARILARRGHRVLALDSDLMPGLAVSLGAEQQGEPPLNEAAERPEGGRWRLRRGIGPVRAVRRYATEAPDGVLLLQVGKLTPEGLQAIMASVQAFYQVIHRLGAAPTFRSWTIVGDLPAGPRQTAFDSAPYAEAFLLLVEPTWKSALTGRRIARLARERGRAVLPVASKTADRTDERRVERLLGEAVIGSVPADPAVVEAERAGAAPSTMLPRPRRCARSRSWSTAWKGIRCGRELRVKIAVAGKGGVGKTTVAGTIARAFARSGRSVVALDADTNPMLGISLGVGPERTDALVAVRQALDEGELEHQPTTEAILETFGADAPDGVRLVVCSRIDTADPG